MLDTNRKPLTPSVADAVRAVNEMVEGAKLYRSHLPTHVLNCILKELHIMPVCHTGYGDYDTYWYLPAWAIEAIKENLPKYRRYVAFRLESDRRLSGVSAAIHKIRDLGFTVPDEMTAEFYNLVSICSRLRGEK